MAREVMSIDCKLYEAADWDGEATLPGTLEELKAVTDVSITLDYDEEEISTRESRIKLYLKSMIELGAEMEINNRGYNAGTLSKKFADAWLPGGNPLCLVFLDGASDQSYFGFIGYFEVTKMPREEKLANKSSYKITVKPTRFNNFVPQFLTNDAT